MIKDDRDRQTICDKRERLSACTLSLEHLFATYISSSSGHKVHNTDVNLLGPTQNYEDLLCESLQTETFKYMTSDHELRVNKIRAIADDKDFQQYAEVCFNQGVGRKNCGECFGCWKTMIPLDLMGNSISSETALIWKNTTQTGRRPLRI